MFIFLLWLFSRHICTLGHSAVGCV